MNGTLIAICGLDGSGKTTQIENLRSYFADSDREVVVTRQPTDRYRQDPLVRSALNLDVDDADLRSVYRELALFAAWDRARHVRELIAPALMANKIVISDRYVYSSFAYFLARGVRDIEWLKQLNRDVPEPALTVYLDVDPTVAIARVIGRDGMSAKREETELERMAAVRSHFLERPWGHQESYVTVDGGLSAAQVWGDILNLVNNRIETA